MTAAPDYTASGNIERWTRANPCPICGGGQNDMRGKGVRCSGFRGSGGYVHCSREDFAGTLQPHKGGDTYAHRSEGPCMCGQTHGDAPIDFMERKSGRTSSKKAKAKQTKTFSIDEVRRIYGKVGTIVAEYSYYDEQGREVLRVFRLQLPDDANGKPKKDFRQASPEGDGWKLSKGTAPLVPFHLPELLAAIAAGKTVYIVEGEKDVLAVEEAGGVATCNVGGANKPLEEYVQHFKGAALVRIVADQDADGKGERHARAWAKALSGVVERVELVAPVEGKDAHDSLVTHGHNLADAFRLVSQHDEDDQGEAEEWDTPIPLGARSVPTFPLEALPDSLRGLCEAVSKGVDACPDLVACAGLGVVSTLTTGRVSVRMSDSWHNPAALYVVALAATGDGKGPAWTHASDPLKKVQLDLREAERDRVERARSEYAIAEKRLEDLTKKAAKATGGDAEDLSRQAQDAAAEFGRMVRPAAPRYYVGDDNTESALATALVQNDQRIGIVSAEARTLFDAASGRHSSHGTPEMRLMLSAWDGEPCEQLRIGRGETDLSNPQLSMTIALQPSTFDGFVRRSELADAGLFNRFLISRPTWSRNLDRLPSGEVSKSVRERWRLLVRDLAELPDRGHHGWLLDFTPEAREAFDAMRLRFRQMGQPGGLFDGFGEYGPKFDANVGRIVGVLHCAELADHGESREGYEGKPIGVDTVERAERIADYFAHHAAASFTEAGMHEGEQRAAIVLDRCRQWTKRGDTESLYRNEAGRVFVDARTIQRDAVGKRRVLKTKADVLEACGTLIEHGWLRAVDNPKPDRKGPPGSWYVLHPMAFDQ